IKQVLSRELPAAEFEEAADVQKFVHAVEQRAFDVVITDYQLGWTNGLAVLRTVKSRQPDCPVIMYASAINQEIAVAALAAGLDDYIAEDSNESVRLRFVVRSALEKARQRREIQAIEARYQSLFDNVPIGLCRITAVGQLVDANLALVQLLRYPDRKS